MDKKNIEWIEAVLANDENSSDAELVAYFMKEGGMTSSEATYWVSKRNDYLHAN